jgi:hypothetical protein
MVSTGGAGAAFITIDPTGKFAYATSGDTGSGSNSVTQFIIGADGTLTLMANPTVLTGSGPNGIATARIR